MNDATSTGDCIILGQTPDTDSVTYARTNEVFGRDAEFGRGRSQGCNAAGKNIALFVYVDLCCRISIR